jgi:hypothetical protein
MIRSTVQLDLDDNIVVAHPRPHQAPNDEPSVWIWPLPILADRRPVIASGRGSRRTRVDGSNHSHLGVDVMYERRSWDDLESEYPSGGPNGTRRYFMPDDVPVLATADGVVRLTKWTSRGLSAVIRHAADWATYYTHLAELAVAPDQAVVAGEPIGTVGHDPPDPQSLKHLSFELWRGGTRRGAVDPEPYLAAWRHVGLTAWSPATVRNAGLVYRPVGRQGEPYPRWLRSLKGKSGVYVIRQDGAPVYVGESHANRLPETLTRHLQLWRRAKGFWKGGYSEGHDPGVTYDRETVEVAVRVTSPDEAIQEEARLIERLRPRDNLIGQPDTEVPF